jgi:hypothetical protein
MPTVIVGMVVFWYYQLICCKHLMALAMISMLLFHSSSSSSSYGKIPFGQGKKMSGSKSARNHAPGHQKNINENKKNGLLGAPVPIVYSLLLEISFYL